VVSPLASFRRALQGDGSLRKSDSVSAVQGAVYGQALSKSSSQ
jgi:hypothetical protein